MIGSEIENTIGNPKSITKALYCVNQLKYKVSQIAMVRKGQTSPK